MPTGVVARLEDRIIDGDSVPGHENYIWIEHEDGTVGADRRPNASILVV